MLMIFVNSHLIRDRPPRVTPATDSLQLEDHKKPTKENEMHKAIRFGVLSHLIFAILILSVLVASGQQPTPPVEVKIDPAVFDAYAGQYEDKANLGDIVFSFFREGDKFYIRVTNQSPIQIFPASESKFFLKTPVADCEFVRDPSGQVTGMVFSQGGRKFTTKKTANTPEKDTRIP